MDFEHVAKVKDNPEISTYAVAEYWMENVKSTTYVVFFYHMAQVITVDSEAIKKVMMDSKNGKCPHYTSALRASYGARFLGEGLFTLLDYDSWKPRRRLHDPAFNKICLKNLVTTTFNVCTDDFLKQLAPLANGKTSIPLDDYITDFTVDVISKAAFGTDFTKIWDAKSLGMASLTDKGQNILTHILKEAVTGCYYSYLSLYPPITHYFHPFEARRYQESANAMRKVGRECIMNRIKTIQNGERPPDDILTHILKLASSEDTADIELLVDDFCTYYVGGASTTSALLSFAIALIQQNPDVLERLMNEIREVLGDETFITAEDLDKLKYTEQILNETLRLYPPDFGITKSLHSDTILDGYVIPANSSILMIIASPCRMPQYFEDPDVFDPSRFDPDKKKPSAYVYLPFGIGHRSCIGRHFAMMEAKLALARLFQTYKISLPEDYKLIPVQRGSTVPRDLSCTLLPMAI